MEEETVPRKFKIGMSIFNTAIILAGLGCLLYSGAIIIENYF